MGQPSVNGKCYRGRFAPSPSGPLHFGSLIAAVGSYLQAKKAGGEWLLRIEDIDTPRVVPGAADAILSALEAYGFEWHGPVVYQSQRTPLYADALQLLQRAGRTYECSCSRKDIAETSYRVRTGAPVLLKPGDEDSNVEGVYEISYPGTCRERGGLAGMATATRFRVAAGEVFCFDDLVQGRICGDALAESGDFVIRRRDGLWAYQLAVVVDDYDQGITEVVRGCDLLDSTPRQLLLQAALQFSSPRYAHLPLVLGAAGRKLSKSTHAEAAMLSRPGEGLWQALQALRQEPPSSLRGASPPELWSWGIEYWTLRPLQHVTVCRASAEP